MKSIKFLMFGADGLTCQLPRIREAMLNLGHIISEESPDLIYANDPTGYQKALSLKEKFPNSFLMLNFLDIPWHFPNVEKQTKLLTDHFFPKADAVTVISYKVKNDLSKFFSKTIQVIYNPIKDVFYDNNIKKNNNFLYVGRANDPIKRINLVKESLSKIRNEIDIVKICGSENPGFGNYLGLISDSELNKLYNSSKFLLLPSKAEGLGLPMIESQLIALELPDTNQPLLNVCTALLQAEINITQTYPLLSRPHGRPVVALMVDNIDHAVETLTDKGFNLITEDDLIFDQ